MGATSVPAISAKTRYALSVLSGTTWTVPAGVTYINATLIGGGGGAGSSGGSAAVGNAGTAGGSTTMTGATTALGGTAGVASAILANNGNAAGVNAVATSGKGGGGAQGYNAGGTPTYFSLGTGSAGADGQIITSTLATTPGASITIAIGTGGAGGTAPTGGSKGGDGGSGRIDIEYWL